MADRTSREIRRGDYIKASNFIDVAWKSLDYVLTTLGHRESTGASYTNVYDSGNVLPEVFSRSMLDKEEADQNGGRSNVFLVNTKAVAGLRARIYDGANALHGAYNVKRGEPIKVSGAVNFLLSAFALASCVRQAYYDVYSLGTDNQTVHRFERYGFSYFNNDSEPSSVDADGNYIFANNKQHIGLLKGSAIRKYGEEAAKDYIWYNWASTGAGAVWAKYPKPRADGTYRIGEVDNNVPMSRITGIDRPTSAHVNVNSIDAYGWTAVTEPASASPCNVQIDGKNLSTFVKNPRDYSTDIGQEQTLRVGNVISASSVNTMLEYLEKFNSHMASSYYCIFSNATLVTETDRWRTITYQYSNGTVGAVYYVRTGGSAVVKTPADARMSIPNFKSWEVTGASPSEVSPGHTFTNIQQNIVLKAKTMSVVINPATPICSWGYNWLTGAKNGINIGDDRSEYKYKISSDDDDEKIPSNLADTTVVSPHGFTPLRSEPLNGQCWAYMRWQNNCNYGNSTTDGVLQRWVTLDVDLRQYVPDAASYKYFLVTSLSVAFNENSPTHCHTWTYLADLNWVNSFDSAPGTAIRLNGYNSTGTSSVVVANCWNHDTWNGTKPFWRKGPSQSRDNSWINPFSNTHCFHVYPILGYAIRDKLVAGLQRTEVFPYHNKGLTNVSTDFLAPHSPHFRTCLKALRPIAANYPTSPPPSGFVHGASDWPLAGYHGLNSNSENIVFKVVNGWIKVGVYISRPISEHGGADQSWGDWIKGTLTTEYPGSGMANPGPGSWYDSLSRF